MRCGGSTHFLCMWSASLGLLVHGGDVLQQVAHAAAVAVLVVVPRHQLDLRGAGNREEMHVINGPECKFCTLDNPCLHARQPSSTQCSAARISSGKQLTKLGERLMPAPASTMDERVSPTKSVDTTASVVKLQ